MALMLKFEVIRSDSGGNKNLVYMGYYDIYQGVIDIQFPMEIIDGSNILSGVTVYPRINIIQKPKVKRIIGRLLRMIDKESR